MYRYLVLTFLLLTSACAPAQAPPLVVPATFDVQGHRGARGLLPENTIPAFVRALELGVTTLELDTVISGDGEVVVSHEPVMSSEICLAPDGTRIRDEDAHNIYRMPYAEVARYDCGTLRPRKFSAQEARPGTPKPLLRDVIRTAEAWAEEHGRPAPQYNVETKSRVSWEGERHPAPAVFAEAVLDVLREKGVLDRSWLQSFDVRTLQAARGLDPTVKLVLLVDNRRGLASNLDALGFVPDVYSPHYRLVSSRLVAAVHERGMALIPWTVNSERRMRRLIALGVDGIITDYPDRLLRVLSKE